jgi:hypothetical protein
MVYKRRRSLLPNKNLSSPHFNMSIHRVEVATKQALLKPTIFHFTMTKGPYTTDEKKKNNYYYFIHPITFKQYPNQTIGSFEMPLGSFLLYNIG